MSSNRCRVAVRVVIAAFVLGAVPAFAQTAPDLGTAEPFAVLAGSTITNTGPTVINGNLGLFPGLAVTGFPPGVVNGTGNAGDAGSSSAKDSLVTAYNTAANNLCTQDLTGQNLGGLTLVPGVYCFSTSAQLTGVLTLNGQGNGNSVFIFKIGSTLTTASGASVVVINDGGGLCSPWWQVGSSATLGTTTNFLGNILALTSITLNTGAQVLGRTLARNGAVTLDSNTITRTTCTPSAAPTPVPTMPQTLLLLLALGLVGAGYLRLQRSRNSQLLRS
ncbi:MAG: ice-binding family protein [Vicinamibacterales bacterium]